MSYEQVFGLSSQFNEDVIFLKNVKINGQLSFGTDITFNVPVTFQEDVTFEKSIFVGENATIDQNLSAGGNLSVGGISTFTGLIDANDSVDIANTLTVQKKLNVGVNGNVLSADVDNEKIGLFNENPTTKFQFNSTENQSIFFDEQGRIGIGTTAGGKPNINDTNQGTLKLDVQGSIAVDRNIYDSTGAPGENNFFLSRDEIGIRWVNIVPQDPVGIFLQDEGAFIPTVGAAQSFSTLNFVQKNSLGIGTDTLIPTAANPDVYTGLSTIFTQDLWGYVGSGDNADIYRMAKVGINNSSPSAQLDITGTVHATGDVDFDAKLNVDGDTTLEANTTDGLLDINAGGQANTFKVEDLTNDRVVIAGSGGELEDDSNLTFNGSTLAVGVALDVDGLVTFDNATDASSTTAASVEIAGGVGIVKKLFVGDDTKIEGTTGSSLSLIHI